MGGDGGTDCGAVQLLRWFLLATVRGGGTEDGKRRRRVEPWGAVPGLIRTGDSRA